MQRYFIDESLRLEQVFHLNDSDNHHLLRVMRVQVGDTVYVVDQEETAYIAEVIAVVDKQVELQVIAEDEGIDPSLPVELTLACGLSKGDKLEWIVQKATELGVDHFIPLALQRDVVRWKGKKAEDRRSRLQKIAHEASSQSHRRNILQVEPLYTLKDLLEQKEGYDYCMVAYEESARKGEQAAFKQVLEQLKQGDKLLVVFGSEGGLEAGEVELLEAHGFIRIGLGPRIMRAETAPLYVASAVSYQLELQ